MNYLYYFQKLTDSSSSSSSSATPSSSSSSEVAAFLPFAFKPLLFADPLPIGASLLSFFALGPR
jgi:hypothetical protein